MHAHRDRSRPAAPLSELILVRGDNRVSLTGPELRGLASEDRIVTIACASRTRHTATWTGVPVLDLFTDAGLGDETVHLLIESTDGYWACIGIYATPDAVVTYARDGTPIDEEHNYETRLIAPDVDRSRTVKGVHTVGALTFDPTTDPESFEDIFEKF